MAAKSGALGGLVERYAAALYELADEAKSLDAVADDLSQLAELMRRDPDTKFKVAKRKMILAQNVMLPKVVNTFF